MEGHRAIESIGNSDIDDCSNAVQLAGTWVEERASHFTTTAAGAITYIGERDFTTPIDIIASVDPVTDITIAIYVFIDGVAVAPTGIKRFVKSADPGVMTTIWQATLSTGNVITARVENQTNTSNILLSDVIFRVR